MSERPFTRLDPSGPPGPITSRCVVHDRIAYIGGLVAADLSADTAGQTREVLERVDAYLRRVGSDRDHILTVQVWLADMRRFAEMNEVWNAWVGDGPPPARACVGGELFRRDAAVEIMVTAAVP